MYVMYAIKVYTSITYLKTVVINSLTHLPTYYLELTPIYCEH